MTKMPELVKFMTQRDAPLKKAGSFTSLLLSLNESKLSGLLKRS
jgi:hypothetical protein